MKTWKCRAYQHENSDKYTRCLTCNNPRPMDLEITKTIQGKEMTKSEYVNRWMIHAQDFAYIANSENFSKVLELQKIAEELASSHFDRIEVKS